MFLSHFGLQAVSHSIFYVFDDFSHSAVMAFFVLSGYVIAYVTERRERDGLSYAISRFCRIYSVVVPAIVLTVVLDLAGRALNPELYAGFSYFGTRGGPFQVASSLFFLNESWPAPTSLFSNTAFWSLNNEVWYYVFFGIVFFVPGRWPKCALVLLLIPFIAERIYLLAPVWLLGVGVRRLEPSCAWPGSWSWFILIASAAAILAGDWGLHSGWLAAHVPWLPPLLDSRLPVWDYLTGLLVAVGFLAGARLTRAWVPPGWALAAIRWLAGMTFSIYLFHRPLLLFLTAALPGEVTDNVRRAAILLISAATLVALSYASERQKDRLKAAVLRLIASPRHERTKVAS